MSTFVIIYPNVDEKKELYFGTVGVLPLLFFFQFCESIGSLLSTNTTLFGGMVPPFLQSPTTSHSTMENGEFPFTMTECFSSCSHFHKP